MVVPASVRVSRVPTYLSVALCKHRARECIPSNIRLATFCLPGSHRLWRGVPTASARFANFLPYVHKWQCVLQNRNLKKLELSVLIIWSSQPLVNIRLSTYLPGNKLPGKNLKGLGSFGFARHYYRNRCLLSLPLPTKMFQFGSLPLHILYIQIWVTRYNPSRVPPFGNPRFKAY